MEFRDVVRRRRMVRTFLDQAVGFGAHRVHFAVHFLQKEIELAAAGLGTVDERRPVCDMPAKAFDFLTDIGSSGRADDLLGDGVLVGLQPRPQLADAFCEPRLQGGAPFVGRGGDALDQGRDGAPPLIEIRAQLCALAVPHRIEL